MITQLVSALAIIVMSLFYLSEEEEESGAATAKSNLKIITETIDITHILITSNDENEFDKNELRVKEREKVRVTLKHKGTLPKTIRGHNFVLLSKGTHLKSFAKEAREAGDTEYIPSENVIAHTKLIGGGESASVEFNAPERGAYDFICTFPGSHRLMHGKLIVE